MLALRYCWLYRVENTKALYELFDCCIANIAAAIAISKGFNKGIECRLVESNLNECRLLDSMDGISEKIFDLDRTAFFSH